MEENKNQNPGENGAEFDFATDAPTNESGTTEDAKNRESRHHSSHHHGSHHHSSRHKSSNGGRSKKHSTHKKAKKLKEPSIRTLTFWLAILTVVVGGLLFWNIDLSSRLADLSDKIVGISSANKEFSKDNVSDSQETESIPTYVKAEAKAVIKRVTELQNENTVSFIAVSDMHMKSDDERIIEGLEHAGQAMGLIREGVEIDFAVSLGDMTWGADKTPFNTGVAEIKKANEFINKGFEGIPNFRLIGNHDLLMYGYENDGKHLNSSELHGLIGKYNDGAAFPQGREEKGYFYRDFEDSKLRVVCLNLNEYKDGDSPDNFIGNYVTSEQVEWFAKTLDLSAKENSAEWKILLLSHQPLNWFEAYSKMTEIVDSYTNGSSGSVTVDGKEISFDFAGKNSAQIIANIHGHMHNFRTNILGTSRIPTVTVPNACFVRNNEYGTAYAYSDEIHNKYGEKTTYAKTAGSSKDTAFCVVTIDFKYRRIYATCYGAGYDREISF